MVSVVQCRCVFSLSSCNKMSVQDTHREREVTLAVYDVIEKGPRMSKCLSKLRTTWSPTEDLVAPLWHVGPHVPVAHG